MPQLGYRCSRWPPQKTIAQELDVLHRKMVSTMIRLPKNPGGDVAEDMKRQGRLAGLLCTRTGKWSHRWFQRAQTSNDHLERARNRHSWPSRLLHYRDRDWLMRRRASLLPADGKTGSCTAGHTDTRTFRGCVHMRWQDGIAYSRHGLFPHVVA